MSELCMIWSVLLFAPSVILLHGIEVPAKLYFCAECIQKEKCSENKNKGMLFTQNLCNLYAKGAGL